MHGTSIERRMDAAASSNSEGTVDKVHTCSSKDNQHNGDRIGWGQVWDK